MIQNSASHASTETEGIDAPAPADEITALTAVSRKGLVIAKLPPPELHAHEVEIAPTHSFISAGTELHSIAARLNAAESEEVRSSRLGYNLCGVITRIGETVRGFSVGDRVVAIGAGAFHATRTIVAQNLVTPLPKDVDPRQAALAAMFCFALESVHKSAVRIGENVVVFGAGMMGQMAARLYQLSGAHVCVMDSNAYRLSLLPEGTTTFPLNDEGWARLAEWARPHGIEHANVAFGGDATTTIEKLKPCMSVAPDGVPHGRIVFPGGAKFTVLMASNMGNIQLISSAKAGPGYRDPHYESGADYPSVYVPHPVRRNVETMLNLIQDGRLDLSKLVTHRFPFADAKAAYAMLMQPNVEALAVLLEY